MSTQLSSSDRTFMRHFFLGIGMLGVVTVIEIIVATGVWASAPKPDNPIQQQQASERISPVSAVYAGNDLPPAPAAAPAAAAAAAPASAAASGPYSYDAAKGKSLFDSTCAACHQATGLGLPGAFPPLKGNAAVDSADPTLHLHTILHGASGVVIGGVKYPSAMPPFASQLSDADIANIANYERSSWGNSAKHVTAADVAAVRAKGN